MATSRSSGNQGPPKSFGQPFLNNINDVNFQFEFPKFGALPGPLPKSDPRKSSPALPLNRANSDQLSPRSDKPKDAISPSNSSSYSQVGLDSQAKEDLASFSAGLFNPPLTNTNVANASRTSLDSHYSNGGATSTSSPSASSNSNMGTSSSCGTSPEPTTHSPMGFKPVDTLTTIGEENQSTSQGKTSTLKTPEHAALAKRQAASGNPSSGIGWCCSTIPLTSTATKRSPDFGNLGNLDVNNFNWLPEHNFQFDPQLFGTFREPQENVLALGYDESFFNDAFEVDFTTPYNVPVNPAAPKKDLIAEIDAAKNSDELGVAGSQLLTCNKIWYESPSSITPTFSPTNPLYREKLQTCPRVQNGDFDLDGLCSDLQKKAKCSGSGAVVDERDFKHVMKKYLGKNDDGSECPMSSFTDDATKA